MLEETLKYEIDKVRRFFETNKKNEKGYYKLYNVKFANSSFTHHNQKGKNFDTETIEESLNRLVNDVSSGGLYGSRFFKLRHFSSPTDSSPIDVVFENPYFDPSTQKGGHNNSGIYGMGSNQNDQSNSMLMSLMEQNHKSTSSLEKKITDLQHSYELEKMEDRISDLEVGGRTFVDAAKSFFESETGAGIVGGLMSILQDKMSQPKAEPQPRSRETPQPQPQPKQQPTQSKEQSEQIEKLNNSLVRMEKVFGIGGVDAVDQISRLFENDPQSLQDLLNKQNQKDRQNENEF